MTSGLELRGAPKFAFIIPLVMLLTAVRPETARSAGIDVVVRDANGAPAFNAVVYAFPVGGKKPLLNVKPVIVDQIDKEFSPDVTVIPVGTPVFFPNDDDIRHHVYSLSQAKMFELPLYSGKKAEPIVFDKPGIVALGCNIHDWMVAFIYVVDTPYFAKTGKDGKARIEFPDDGEYNLFVWHPWMKGKPEDMRKTVRADGHAMVEFGVKLKANLHIRRAPAIGGGAY